MLQNWSSINSIIRNSAHLLPPRKACLFPLPYKVLIHFHNPLVARCSSSGYMSAASGSEDPRSNQIQILLSQKVLLQRLSLYENQRAQDSNSFPKKKKEKISKLQQGVGGQRGDVSIWSVCESEWMCLCVHGGQPSAVSPSLIPPRQSKSPATALQLHTHPFLHQGDTKPPDPPHPTPNQGCSQIPESQMTCPLCSHNLSFSVSVVKNTFLCLLMKCGILLLLLCKGTQLSIYFILDWLTCLFFTFFHFS